MPFALRICCRKASAVIWKSVLLFCFSPLIMIVGVECASDFRAMTGDRRLPPYASSGRAWLVRAGEAPEVVAIE